MQAETIHDYLMRISRLLQAEAREVRPGLQPVQLQALQYLNHCNRYSDTPAGVAEYLDATRGTVSQSLRILEEQDLISRHPDPKDGRVVHLHATALGRKVLRSGIPPKVLRSALTRLGDSEAENLEAVLRTLLRTVQNVRGGSSFGICETCRHFTLEGETRFRCGLTQEVLLSRDRNLLCREHEESE